MPFETGEGTSIAGKRRHEYTAKQSQPFRDFDVDWYRTTEWDAPVAIHIPTRTFKKNINTPITHPSVFVTTVSQYSPAASRIVSPGCTCSGKVFHTSEGKTGEESIGYELAQFFYKNI